MRKQFNFILVFVLLFNVFLWSCLGFLSFKLYTSVSEVGLKKTIETVWEGPSNSTIKGEN